MFMFCDVMLIARRKSVIHSDAQRHTLISQAPCVLRLLLKRFMQVLLPLILFTASFTALSGFVCMGKVFN